MSLVRVALTILFAVVSPTLGWAQTNERAHELGEKALTIIRAANDDRYQSGLLSEVALLQARNGIDELAQELFEKAIAIAPKNDTWQIFGIARNLALAGRYDEALKTAQRTRTEANADYHPWLCLSALAGIAAGKREWDKSRNFIDQIKVDHYRAVALADVAVIAHKLGESNKAREFLDESIKIARDVNKEPVPTLTEEVIVERLTRLGLKDLIPDLVREVLDSFRSEGRWRSVMLIEAQCGNVEAVEQAWERAKKSPDASVYIHDHTIADLATANLAAGELDKARETSQALRSTDSYLLVAIELSRAFIDAGRIDDAIQVMESTPESDRDKRAYFQSLLDLAEATFREDRKDKAKSFLEEAGRRAVNIGEAFLRDDFSLLGAAYGKYGLDVEFEIWTDGLRSPFNQATALVGLANGILDREQKAK